MKSGFALLLFLLLITSIYSQKFEYTVLSIPDSLKQNANAVVRLDQTDIVISSQRDMTTRNKRIVTVFNEKGMNAIDAYESYDKKTNIRSIEAIIYDQLGNEIKKIKRKDFRDQSAVDGFSLFSDNRYLLMEYTPTQYPFTVVFESEINTSNTAFIPPWMPLGNYYVSYQKSQLNVTFPAALGFKKKEVNFGGFPIDKTTDTARQLSYTAKNIPAQKYEDLSLPFGDIFPKLMMGLDFFNLEGIDGNATSWKEMGLWWSNKILSDTQALPEETIAKMKALVGDEKDPMKKARLVYNYVQQKSRYVSIQEGIGGWKPMLAKDVDRLGYGDCKALSNYTRALLNAVDVPAYYTRLYGGPYKKDVMPDFVSMQSNHVILALPNGNDYVFLECTSQVDPFGYQANFTDDRTVLIMKPDGGEVVRTRNYQDKDNARRSKGNYSITQNGDFSGAIEIVSEGSQYSQSRIETMLPNEKEANYKDHWSNINNLKIGRIAYNNDKEQVKFTENLSLTATGYGAISGNRMMVVVNAYNQLEINIKRVRNRKTPFEIERGSYDTDEIAIALPSGFALESVPNDFVLTNKFGEYKTEIIKKGDSNLVYKRSLLIRKGVYAKDQYEEYRLFIEQVSRKDNAKMILTKT